VSNTRDLDRLVLKSETATLIVPAAEAELTIGSLGANMTTIEGLLKATLTSLKETNPFSAGDSAASDKMAPFARCIAKINAVCCSAWCE